MTELHHLGVAELAALLQTKQVSAVEVATRFLARTGGNPHNAFLDIDSEVTLAQARASDAKLANGSAGPLEGVPIAHKDVFVTKDLVSTAGSRMLNGYHSPFDATVVARLRQAGMVTLGKLNCDEFAMGSSNENSAFGPVRNAWDAGRVLREALIRSALDSAEQAVELGLVHTNVAARVRGPKVERKEARALSVEDARLLLAAAEEWPE